MINPHLLSDFIRAKNALIEGVAKEFPIGSWAAVMKFEPPKDAIGIERYELAGVPAEVRFVGKIHAYCENPLEIDLVLEHGHVRRQSVASLVAASPPYWSKYLQRAVQ